LATLLSRDTSIAATFIGLKLEAGDPMDEEYPTISEALKIRKVKRYQVKIKSWHLQLHIRQKRMKLQRPKILNQRNKTNTETN
jgi:hypothetical protein